MSNTLKNIFKLLLKLFYESGDYTIYTYNGTLNKNQTSLYKIVEYKNYSDIPKFIIKKIFNLPFLNPLYYRLKSNNAHLISVNSGKELVAYGWIQSWKPFKRKFGWLFNNAIMLGPYWTHEQHRGKGIYGDLLKYSLAHIPNNIPIIIYTAIDNVSSQKGIEKSSFKLIGNFRITLFVRRFSFHKKLNSY